MPRCYRMPGPVGLRAVWLRAIGLRAVGLVWLAAAVGFGGFSWPALGTQPARPAPAEGAVVLMYHRFGESRYPSTNIPLPLFEAHLAELKRGRYRVLPLPRIVAALRGGKPLPPRAVAITIDDAYRSVYTQAWPRLRAAGFPFTVFVATGAVDRGFRAMMTWEQLGQMAAGGGVTLGNHTAGHPHLPDGSPAAAASEIATAARRIEERTGLRPTLFAYPYGEYSLEVRQMAVDAGLLAAFGQHSGVVAPGVDRFALPRFALNGRYGTLQRFRLIVNTLPFPVDGEYPPGPLVRPGDNPPRIGFAVRDEAGRIERVRCYGPAGALPLKFTGGRGVEIRPGAPFPPGRTRINCTLPAPGGRWRWYGRMFYRPGN